MRKVNNAGLALLLGLLTVLSPLPAPAQTGRAAAAVKASASGVAPAVSAASRASAERITAEKLKETLYFIASDEMAGRNTPSPELDKTAQYIAERLAKLKLKPAGDNKKSYFQTIVLRSTEVDQAKTSAALGARAFKFGTDFLPSGRTGGEAEGPLVYVGHGWVFKPKNINAYEGLDVAGKIMVVSGNGTTPPTGLTLPEVRAASAGDWESPVSYARKHGAKALVLVPRNFERAWRFGGALAGRPTYRVARFEDEAAGTGPQLQPQPTQTSGLPMLTPSREMLSALFEGEQLDGARVLQAAVAGEALKGFDLSASKRLRVALSLRVNQATTQNVVAVLEGKDSKLKKEYVALGAHYDHVGVGRAVNGDSIYNGADDDGSGTTALLAMAEAFSKGPRPKRSILFVWHAGEEKGLWGSQYFTEYPTVPLSAIVTQLNIDMIGRSKKEGDTNPRNKMLTGPDEIYVIGSKMMSTELGNLSESVNTSYLGLKFNYHYDQPNDPEQLFYRSDHFNYAKRGVPIIFYFDGVHEDYHQPSDTADKIDYDKMLKITRTVFVLASELANAPARPVVDKLLPPERMQRN